jgi:hypothetical protein
MDPLFGTLETQSQQGRKPAFTSFCFEQYGTLALATLAAAAAVLADKATRLREVMVCPSFLVSSRTFVCSPLVEMNLWFGWTEFIVSGV